MNVEYNGLSFERLGHASIRIETNNSQVIYIDPWSDVLDEHPHDGDVVFVTHDDMDHYDPDAIAAVANEETTLAAYEAIETAEVSIDVVSLPEDGETTVADIDVRTLPAYNRTDGDHTDEDGEPFHAPGEVIGLLLAFDDTTVYFTSDTDFLDEHTDLQTDVFIPPIGGGFTMDRVEAAKFARSINPDLILPVHYDTFEAIETDAEAFKEELEADDLQVELF